MESHTLKVKSPSGNNDKIYVIYSNCLPELTYPESEYQIYLDACKERGFEPTDYDQWVENRIDTDIRVLLDELSNQNESKQHIIAIIGKDDDVDTGEMFVMPYTDGNIATALATSTGGLMELVHKTDLVAIIIYHDGVDFLAIVADGNNMEEVKYNVWFRKLNPGVDGDEIGQKFSDGDIDLDDIMEQSSSVLPDVLKIFDEQ